MRLALISDSMKALILLKSVSSAAFPSRVEAVRNRIDRKMILVKQSAIRFVGSIVASPPRRQLCNAIVSSEDAGDFNEIGKRLTAVF
jgi:hypothetical protein